MNPPAVVSLVHLGCARNLIDSELILGRLADEGLVIAGHPDDADTVVLNTCSFIGPARAESEAAIQKLLKRKKRGEIARVVVDETVETVEADEEVAVERTGDVVLQPQPPPAARPTPPAAPKHALAVDDVVYRAGCLFLERQRVAVSMLQREFGLDFKAATAVLDHLQTAGLIGPYLGGQRRDVLITREQWDELAQVS